MLDGCRRAVPVLLLLSLGVGVPSARVRFKTGVATGTALEALHVAAQRYAKRRESPVCSEKDMSHD